MEIQGEKTSKISCTLYKLTSVSVNFTLEISCTVCKTSLWKMQGEKTFTTPYTPYKLTSVNTFHFRN